MSKKGFLEGNHFLLQSLVFYSEYILTYKHIHISYLYNISDFSDFSGLWLSGLRFLWSLFYLVFGLCFIWSLFHLVSVSSGRNSIGKSSISYWSHSIVLKGCHIYVGLLGVYTVGCSSSNLPNSNLSIPIGESIHFFLTVPRQKKTAHAGFEPATLRLTAARSTNWANRPKRSMSLKS